LDKKGGFVGGSSGVRKADGVFGGVWTSDRPFGCGSLRVPGDASLVGDGGFKSTINTIPPAE
jgi:hypothetical protein